MTKEELYELDSHTPVLCRDGRFGLLIQYPSKASGDCGIQVPGEENIRWIHRDSLTKRGGGLVEVQA